MPVLKLYMLFIAISFVVGTVVYLFTDYSHKYLKFLTPFLLLTLIVELIGSYLGSKGKNNLVLYNFFSVFTICYYLNIIRFIISSKIVKKIIIVTIIAYAIIAVVNILFIQKMNTLHTVTYSLGCLLVVAFCIYYFLELFRLPKSVNLRQTPAFWICSGLLFFFCCGFPLYGFINFWAKIPFIVKNLGSIITILNIFLYSLFTISFLCVRTRKYTLSSS